LSTAEVYRHCRPAKSPCRLEGLLEAAQRGQTATVGRALFNGLQAAAEELSPWIGRVQAAFRRTDCCGHQMSGSGTSYFGICRHARQACRVAGQLRAARVGAVFRATTLSACGPGVSGEPT
jgi:4-diphosphocytidyl-2-C-methyl-D-erythritol kinase